MASWQYVYCIIEGSDLPPGTCRGLEDAPVQAVAYRGISAIVSPLPHRQVPVTREHLLLHERLVEELMGRRTVLPVRFGTVLGNTSSLRLELSRQYDCYLNDLDRVRGKVELGVRVLAPNELPEMEERPLRASLPSGPGTRYLMERLGQHASAQATRERFERWAQMIDACLMHHAEDRRASWAPSEKGVMSAAYLVWQQEVPVFKEKVKMQSEAWPELQFLLTGPWPAYSFVGEVASSNPDPLSRP